MDRRFTSPLRWRLSKIPSCADEARKRAPDLGPPMSHSIRTRLLVAAALVLGRHGVARIGDDLLRHSAGLGVAARRVRLRSREPREVPRRSSHRWIETLAMTFTRLEPPRHVVVRDAYTDVWVLRGGEWLLVNAQHTAVRAFLQAASAEHPYAPRRDLFGPTSGRIVTSDRRERIPTRPSLHNA